MALARRSGFRSDNTWSFKYWSDPNAVAQAHGNDIPKHPVFRHIPLSRAEGLEINGPNQELQDLQPGQIQGRVEIVSSAFTTTESLREHLLERDGVLFRGQKKRRYDPWAGKAYLRCQSKRYSQRPTFFPVALFPIPSRR